MAYRLTSFAASARRYLADSRGIAAVEMAFIAPIALGLLSLGVAGGQSLTLYHKVVLSAHTVTDLVSRTVFTKDPNKAGAELLNESELDTDMVLSQMLLYPASTTNLKVVMSELQVDAPNNRGKVVWSEGCNSGVALTVGSYVSLDPSYTATGASYLVYGQVSYTFQPLGGVLSLPSITLNSSEMLTIRNAQQITVTWNGKQC